MSTTQFTGLISTLTRQRGVLGCLVVSERDGIIVDADVQAGVDAAAVAALAAALYRRSRLCSEAAGLSTVSFLQLESERGHICAAGRDDLVAVVIAETGAPVAQLRTVILQSVDSLV
ncbi:MAG TPA: roadblock/LC7 domain-containing protein [Gemmatimonadaceae bacterium]|nr:roadblock/LC7 domain-containing protein [Gemmatimonadaceae bacterium]